MTKNNKNATVKDAARHFWGETQFEYATNNKLEKVKSDICMLSDSFATDGSFMIYGAGELEFEPVKNSRYCDPPREQIEPVIMPYINASVCAKVPSSLFGHLAAGHSKKIFLAAAGRWCSFVANDVDHGMHVEDGADMGDFFNLGGIKATFDGTEIAKIFRKFKVDGVEICRPSKGSDFMRFYVTFKGAKFTAVLLKCYRDDYNADYEDEAFKLAEKWDREDVKRAQDERNVAEIVAAVANYPTAPVAACEAPRTDDSADDNGAGDMPEYTIKPSTEHGGSEIYFKAKPAQKVRDAMKSAGFRWHGAKLCWYSKKMGVDDARALVMGDNRTEMSLEGENDRWGMVDTPKAETAPEAKETAKDEAPANLERVTGERLTHAELMAHPEKCPELGDLVEVSDSPVKSQNGFFVITSWNSKKYLGNSSFYGLGVKRNAWDDTTKNNLYWPPRNTSGTRAAHEANATHTPKMRVLGPVSLAGLDFVRAEFENAKEWQRRDDRDESRAYVDECREALARMEEENPALFRATRKEREESGTGLKIAKNGFYVREGGKWELYGAFYSVDNRCDGRPCVTVYARSYGDLPNGFGLEIVNDSDPYTDYVTGDRATVYEDHPLYKKFREAAAGEKHYHLTAEDVENVREYVENKMETAKKAREAEEEARRAKYEEQERHAREVIAEYVELFPGDAYHPHIVVEWSELGAMEDRGRLHGDSTIFSVEAFEAITGDLDKYFEGDLGYNKLKFTFYAGGGSEFTDRCDLGDGGGSYGKRMRHALAHAGERASNGYVMLDGGAVVGLDEYEENARKYLENLAVTWDEIGAA